MEIKIGDWVSSYGKGIWQVFRIANYICIDPLSGDKIYKTTVFSKRFLSGKMKRSFSVECCDPAFVKVVDQEVLDCVNAFIKGNPKIFKEFCEYKPKPIDCVYNARIGVPEEIGLKQVNEMISGDKKYKDSEINALLVGLGFDVRKMPSWTVQFLSENFDIVDGYLMYKFNRVFAY